MFAVVTDQLTAIPETALCHVHAGGLVGSGLHVEDCSEDLALACRVCGVSRHNEQDPIYQNRPNNEAYPEDTWD
jgi:hypothetical protein